MARREKVPGEKEKAPAFQLYVKELLSDSNQAGMSLQETGAYIRMMCFEWNEHGRGLPDDVVRCARMVGATPGAMRKMWPTLRACFRPHATVPSRLIHPRLEIERLKQAAFRRRQTDNAARRWEARQSMPHASQSDATAYPTVMPSGCQSDALLSPISDHRSKEQIQIQKISSEASSEPPAPAFLEFPVVGTGSVIWGVPVSQITKWRELFPGLEVEQEIRKALAWIEAHPDRRKTSKGMPRFLVAWLTRATDRGPGNGRSGPGDVISPLGKLSTRMALAVGRARAGVTE